MFYFILSHSGPILQIIPCHQVLSSWRADLSGGAISAEIEIALLVSLSLFFFFLVWCCF